MKSIRFLSQFTLICNIAFLFFWYFQWRDATKPVTGSTETLKQLPFLKDTIIVLGVSAIAICFLMNLVYLFFFISGRRALLPRTLVAINFFFLLLEVFRFFFT
jgi:hypothetical protein